MSIYSFLFSKTKESKGIGYFHLNLREKTNVIPLTMAPEPVLTMGCSELGVAARVQKVSEGVGNRRHAAPRTLLPALLLPRPHLD